MVAAKAWHLPYQQVMGTTLESQTSWLIPWDHQPAEEFLWKNVNDTVHQPENDIILFSKSN